MKFFSVLALLWAAHRAQAKSVFAHFMVSNAQNYTAADWTDEISLAQDAHIEAFALNTAYNQGDGPQYELAFAAAESAGFKLFFSFDYAGNGAWPKSEVTRTLQQYIPSSAYFTYAGQPFVSTFEGPASSDDWKGIKEATGCFFVPDWSSLGAQAAMEQSDNVADGLFSWAAWPWGDKDMNTFVDASYLQYLNGKPYMMPVSPWFYTNLPGYDKNWLWRGDDLWADRWREVLYVQPDFVEIISWNDYGESHYIGPIHDKALGAMYTGRAPVDYVTGMPHDAWRLALPFAIDMYTLNTTTVTEETVVFWYRTQPATACGSGDTTGNTASQLQYEFDPAAVVQDRVFFTAVLGSKADVSVSIGGVSQAGQWTDTPNGNGDGTGIYHGSVPFNGNLGEVTVTVSREGSVVASGTGVAITTSCGPTGLENWNAWVGSGRSSSSISATPTAMDDLVCVNGTSIVDFEGLCEFGCELGYCPIGACLCEMMGEQRKKPKPLNINGYPVAGLNDNYDGLCAFDCNLGYCPTGVCTTVSEPLTTPTVSPFTPDACTSGEGDEFPGLCNYACNFGFCPRNTCTCTDQGPLHVPPAVIDGVSGSPPAGVNDYGLCAFACSRGYCPEPCIQSNNTGGAAGTPVYIDPTIWSEPTPVVSCIPPCVLILPPYPLPTPTTIEFPPLTVNFTQAWVDHESTTAPVTVTFPPITTTEIPVFNINITTSGIDAIWYHVTPSILPVGNVTFTPPAAQYESAPTGRPDPVVVPVTSTPVGTSTWPVITDRPTKVSFRSASPPGPTCTSGLLCGKECRILCDACGILGCGEILGLGIDVDCVGAFCPGSDDDDDGDDDCSTYTTVERCTEFVSSTMVQTTPATSWSTMTGTYCDTIIDCDATGGTTTTTITTSFAPDPTAITDEFLDMSDTSDYSGEDDVFASVQSAYNAWEQTADIAASPKQITTVVTTAIPTSTTKVIAPTEAARCDYYDEGWGWRFWIYDISGWSTDGGASLHDQEKGCGLITDWDCADATDTTPFQCAFNLPFFIKAGCVERAIVSAGGPEISCTGHHLTNPAPYPLDVADTTVTTTTAPTPTFPPPINPNYTYTENTSGASYIPMTWNATDNGTVVLTWTYTTTETEVVTTWIPITGSSVPPSTVASMSATPPSTSASSSATSATDNRLRDRWFKWWS